MLRLNRRLAPYQVNKLPWINLIFALAAYCRKKSGTSLQAEVDKVCTDGEALFNEVFPRYKGKFTEELHSSMIEGARYVQVPINTRGEDPVKKEVSEEDARFVGISPPPDGRGWGGITGTVTGRGARRSASPRGTRLDVSVEGAVFPELSVDEIRAEVAELRAREVAEDRHNERFQEAVRGISRTRRGL